ncbi:hypothetical protein KFK09_014861 [Dendrobium nobile]|uniref:Uncharacterized protein n=1 Tax=Dendrobium nobile TaxID=94219 RepID=A0A8T3B4I6_DENNO|nr:hypothetical protein KFK09_014861 [Dendrobium nobile]
MGMNLDSGELLAVLLGTSNASKEKAHAHIREFEEEVKLLKNLSHLNIVGANIINDNKGNFKLADFGTSKQVAKLLGFFISLGLDVLRLEFFLFFGLDVLVVDNTLHGTILARIFLSLRLEVLVIDNALHGTILVLIQFPFSIRLGLFLSLGLGMLVVDNALHESVLVRILHFLRIIRVMILQFLRIRYMPRMDNALRGTILVLIQFSFSFRSGFFHFLGLDILVVENALRGTILLGFFIFLGLDVLRVDNALHDTILVGFFVSIGFDMLVVDNALRGIILLGLGASIQLANTVINTGITGVTIQFGSVNFPAIKARTTGAPTHSMHLLAQLPVAESPRKKVYVFERLPQPEALTARRIVNGGRVSMVTTNTTPMSTSSGLLSSQNSERIRAEEEKLPADTGGRDQKSSAKGAPICCSGKKTSMIVPIMMIMKMTIIDNRRDKYTSIVVEMGPPLAKVAIPKEKKKWRKWKKILWMMKTPHSPT